MKFTRNVADFKIINGFVVKINLCTFFSSLILRSFRQGGGGVLSPFTSKQTPKKPTQIRVNKEFRFFLCVTDIYCKYAWVIPLKDKKGITITDAFHKILARTSKPSKIWV